MQPYGQTHVSKIYQLCTKVVQIYIKIIVTVYIKLVDHTQ